MKNIFLRQCVFIVIAICFVTFLVGTGFMFRGQNSTTTVNIIPSDSTTEAQSSVAISQLSKSYENKTNRFSLQMPEEFSAQEILNEDGDGTTVIMQDLQGNGIQISIRSYDAQVHDLTVADIRTALPDLAIKEEQIVEIGNSYKGVAFRSNNEAYGGDSRDVWFVFRGTLYQISTYARNDSLLKAMFSTWKFF